MRVLSLVPGSEAHSLMLFFGSASRAFLQCPAASSRYSSVYCRGSLLLSLDSAFSTSPALTGISLLRSAGGDGGISLLRSAGGDGGISSEHIGCRFLPSRCPPEDYSSQMLCMCFAIANLLMLGRRRVAVAAA